MTALAIVFAAAALAFAIAQALRVPTIPFLLLGGVALNLLAPAGVPQSDVGPLLEVGLSFLVFFAGLSLTPSRLKGLMRPVLWVAVCQFLAVGALGALLALWMGFGGKAALYLGAGLGTSSTLVVVRHLQRSGPVDHKRLALGVVLAQDLALVVLIALIGEFGAGAANSFASVVKLAAFAAGAIFLQRMLPRLAARFPLVDEELLLLGALAFLFAFAGAVATAGLNHVAGAFCAGFALSGFPLGGVVRSALDSLNTFFAAAFFVALGTAVDLADSAVIGAGLAFTALLFLVTPPLVAFLAERKGRLNSRAAITTGLLLCQTSEFSLILAIYGETLGHIPHQVVAIITFIGVVSMSLSALFATPSASFALLRFRRILRKRRLPDTPRDHALVLGHGANGAFVLRPIRKAGIPAVVVDQDSAVVRTLREQGVDAIQGDAGVDSVLERAGVADARFIVSNLPAVEDHLRVIECARGVPVIARVFEQSDAETIERAGGIPVINALATADAFLLWFDIAVAD